MKPELGEFLEKPEIKLELSRCLQDMHKGKNPQMVAEILGDILIDGLKKMQKMPEIDYYELVSDIVVSLNSCFSVAFKTWDDKIILIKTLEKVWVTCEPPTDFVKDHNSGGGYQLLLAQLAVNALEEIVYFQSEANHYEKLKEMLKSDGIDSGKINKLKMVKLERLYPVPVALYCNNGIWSGWIGEFHPKITKALNGLYYFDRPIPKGWSEDLSPPFIKHHQERLNEVKNKME